MSTQNPDPSLSSEPDPALSSRNSYVGMDGAITQSRRAIQYVTLIYGVVFLLVGVLGFIPGVTTNYDSMTFAGHHSEAMLLGIFQVSVLHNIVHLLYGIVGLIAWLRPRASRHYMRWGGLVYAALWIYGLIIDQESSANFVPLNDANNWLHFGLAITMIGLSFLPTHDHKRGTTARPINPGTESSAADPR